VLCDILTRSFFFIAFQRALRREWSNSGSHLLFVKRANEREKKRIFRFSPRTTRYHQWYQCDAEIFKLTSTNQIAQKIRENGNLLLWTWYVFASWIWTGTEIWSFNIVLRFFYEQKLFYRSKPAIVFSKSLINSQKLQKKTFIRINGGPPKVEEEDFMSFFLSFSCSGVYKFIKGDKSREENW
jgi:hypothetical protein